MTTTEHESVRDHIEAEARKQMADMTKRRGFDSGKKRQAELDRLDALFDDWLELSRP